MSTRLTVEAGRAQIEKFEITSNYDAGTENYGPRCVELCVYESVFDSTVRASGQFVDAGYNKSNMSANDERFNMTAGEKTEIKIVDGRENYLEFTGDYQLRVRKQQREQFSTPSNTYVNFFADFYSKESMENHLVEKRATKKFEGFPDEHIQTLISDVLGSPKNIQVDPTIIPYNFLGYSEKVFHHTANLCNKGCHEKYLGKTAGYLFYEVAKGTDSEGGYRYKSIDILFEQEPKRKYIFNNNVKKPDGYDDSILNYYENVSINADSELMSGATAQWKSITFQPYLKLTDENIFDYKDQEQVVNNAGKEFHKIASDLEIQTKATRKHTRVWDNSALPHGKNWAEQQPHSKELLGPGNYDIEKLIRQSHDRFNQLLGIQITILIPMDLTLHVGDLVQCDLPQVDSEKTEDSKNRSGIYMILDLCHRITPNTSYTSIHLSRDSTIYKK